MGLGMIEIVRVLQQKSGDAKPSFYFEDGQEGDLTLTYGFQAFDRLSNLPLLLVHVRQSPQSLRHRFHFPSPNLPITQTRHSLDSFIQMKLGLGFGQLLGLGLGVASLPASAPGTRHFFPSFDHNYKNSHLPSLLNI